MKNIFLFIFGSLMISKPALSLPSVSERYAYLANDSEARMMFAEGQIDKLKPSLLKSSDYTPVAKLLTPLYDGLRVRKTLKLDELHNLVWIDNGIEKTSQIVLVDLTQSRPNQEIFSNFQQGIGIADIIIDFSVSPNGQFVDVISSEYGSIDQVECFIVNILTHEVVSTLHLASNLRSWNSPNTILYNKLDDDGSQSFSQFDVSTMNENNFNGYIIGSNLDLVLIESISDQLTWFSIQNKADGSIVKLDWPANFSPTLIGDDADQAYFLTYDIAEKASANYSSGPTFRPTVCLSVGSALCPTVRTTSKHS